MLHYKTDQLPNGFDRESIKTKYVNITTKFVKQYPRGEVDREDFPKPKPEKEFTKERILPKVKTLQIVY